MFARKKLSNRSRVVVFSVISFRKLSVDIIPNILICQLFLICSQFVADEDTEFKLWEIFIH